MNDQLVEKFNIQFFTKGSAILRIKNYNPKSLIIQHLPIKEKVNKIEVDHMSYDYIIDTLTSVEIQEIVRFGGKVNQNSKSIICKEKFEISPFRKVIDTLFA